MGEPKHSCAISIASGAAPSAAGGGAEVGGMSHQQPWLQHTACPNCPTLHAAQFHIGTQALEKQRLHRQPVALH